MKKEYLSEAFRQLELLNEEDFNLSTTADNSDLKDFLDNDDMSVMSLDVIDPEAETEEDLEDSYTGKVILDCCVCHSKLYKDKEEVQIDEEQDLANVGEECPFCYSNDGFKIIGEVAPYGETEEETEIEEEPEDIEHEENKEDMDEGFKTELIPNNGRKSFYGKAVVDTLDDGSQVLYSYNTPIIKKYPNGELKRLYDGWSATTGNHIKAFCGLDKKGFLNLEYEQFNESLNKGKKLKESKHSLKESVTDDYYDIVNSLAEYASEYLEEEPNRDVYECIDEVVNSNLIYYVDQWTVLQELGESPLEYYTDDVWDALYSDIADRMKVPEEDDETNESLKTRKNRRLKESLRGVDAELIADEDEIRDYLSDDDDEDLRIALKHLGDMGTVIDDSIHVTVRFSDGDRITLPKMFFEFYTYESLKTRKNRKLKESYEKEGYYAKVVHDTLIKVGVDYIDIGADQEGDSIIVRVYNETPYTSNDLRKVWLKLHTPEAEGCDISEDEDGDSVMIFEFSLDEDFDESLKTRKNRKLKESVKNGYRGSKDIEFVWKGHWSDPELVYDGKTFNYWDIENALWSMFLEENPQWKDSDSDNPECEDEFDKYVQLEGALYLDDVIAGGYFDEPSEKNESVNESEDGRKLFTEYKILVDGRTYEISHTKQRADEIVPILKDMYPDSEIEAKPYKHYASGIERKRLERQIADQLKEYGVNESVNESIQEIEIETDTDKIKIESEPKEESGETEDILAPVSPETEQQIENNSSDEVDVPIDEFDEETFDELGESFLKNTYENVESYKTESIKEQDGNKLVVEGLITFNSGKVKKTSFIFEAKDITKSGKVRFIGENCQLSRGKKSFTVAGKVQEGKFISESLNYNYRAKDAKSGKSTRMYGTVRTNK